MTRERETGQMKNTTAVGGVVMGLEGILSSSEIAGWAAEAGYPSAPVGMTV
ncbi:hypothetical protein BH24CHL4_BH24CHL4_20600 [soil metagenome]